MNTNLFSESRRKIAILAFAATLALTATFGQSAIGHLFGVDGPSIAHACQEQGSNGGC